MRRRQFVSLVGAGLATTAFAGTVSGRSRREPPSDQIDNASVHPLGVPKSDPIQVSTGEWITHYIGWVDKEGGDEAKEDVQRWLDSVEMSAWVDGEEVEDVDQYWGDIEWEEEEETFAVWWKYSTPPKSPGLYTFTIEMYYPDGYEDGEFEIEAGERKEFTSYYEVTSGNGKEKK